MSAGLNIARVGADLHTMAKLDDISGLVRLLKEGENIDKRDPYGYTPLHWACQKGHTHTVQAILAAGANVNVRDKWRRTPLHRAAKEGHKEVVSALLDSGAEINAQGDNNWTPLHCSSFHGKLEIVEMLLRHGADENAEDLRGRTSAAVCDMGLYDVDQSVKSKILQLLNMGARQQGLEMPRSTGMVPNLDAAAAAAAAAASSAAATAAVDAGRILSGTSHESSVAPLNRGVSDASLAAASAVSASLAADKGVFALWDTSLAVGGTGGLAGVSIGSGGIIEEEWTDAEDAAWQEMWAMLHVPDPDDPDNNLYSEVKILRKDVKRLKTDLDGSMDRAALGNDGNAAHPSSPVNTAMNNANAHSTEAGGALLSETRTTVHANTPAFPSTASRGRDGDAGEADGVPASKRKKMEGSTGVLSAPTAGTEGAGTPSALRKTTSSVIPVGANGGGGGGGIGDAPDNIVSMGEDELRQQLLQQTQLMAKMAEELEKLRSSTAAAAAPAGGALPVLEDCITYRQKVR